MLYRDLSATTRSTLLGRLRGTFTFLSAARRRRIADLDLMSMGPHMRRDLGLDGGPWLR